jgi:dephospho-CoA kinase
MKTCGLTGGIGMGKSTAGQWLRARGVPVVDADELARQLVEPGQPALAEIQNAFGHEIIGTDGRLRRDELARIVFGDVARRKTLEAILHPAIRAAWLRQLAEWRADDKPLAVVVIPLLFETNAGEHFDATICVACSAPTQRQRLMNRGWTPEQIQQRLAAQWPAEQKIARADFVVWTEGALESHAQQLDQIISNL